MTGIFKRLLLLVWTGCYLPLAHVELNIEITEGIESALPIAVVPFAYQGVNGLPEQAEAVKKAVAEKAATEAAAKAAIDAIKKKVNRSWIRPPTASSGMKCTIQVDLSAQGEVLGEPRIISSSGDEIFDNSAVSAVLKAQPLPVPGDKEQFAKAFRSFTFTFEPK
ncbi:MAG: protein TolA [Methylobacter sp.]|nr:MAG: protein TolA [Methylobacter sp.]